MNQIQRSCRSECSCCNRLCLQIFRPQGNNNRFKVFPGVSFIVMSIFFLCVFPQSPFCPQHAESIGFAALSDSSPAASPWQQYLLNPGTVVMTKVQKAVLHSKLEWNRTNFRRCSVLSKGHHAPATVNQSRVPQSICNYVG